MIHETVVTTVTPEGKPHIAPMGVRQQGDTFLLMPFLPSATYDNVISTGCAVVNFTTDVRVFAGCVTGRRTWPTVAARHVRCVRLADTLAHAELRLASVEYDSQRPTLVMECVARCTNAPFTGLNRAQAAVIEGAVLISRLTMLPREKIDAELAYLSIAIGKTAGPRELQAWQWLMDAVHAFFARPAEADHVPTEEAL
ncbi:DUF447 domain-containing protein [Paraburkholderia phymatum]|uniref:Tetrahydromethanopterin synthesis protein n=1 Tax=Paraburkholderia phymatum (strain DSM 17167 / CIP 108236 / LMG 21445 / STM815) TaxID=391038 RepID=B2JVM7_PARP8|nr:DUF447 domain-containing protein [Paraburkholderia phymatum]ACC75004.1 conserved hypothetical protein [Paraburkholderia phymatum STM815]